MYETAEQVRPKHSRDKCGDLGHRNDESGFESSSPVSHDRMIVVSNETRSYLFQLVPCHWLLKLTTGASPSHDRPIERPETPNMNIKSNLIYYHDVSMNSLSANARTQLHWAEFSLSGSPWFRFVPSYGKLMVLSCTDLYCLAMCYAKSVRRSANSP
jgi:hypothetical protein